MNFRTRGSRSSTGPAFLEAVRPGLALVSAGRRNPFGHPSPDVLGRLAASGARVYRTDRDGAIVLETDGATLDVTRWAAGHTETLDLGRAPEPAGHTTAPGGVPRGP